MIYLSGVYSVVPERYRHRLGYMLNVNQAVGREQEVLERYTWALDNGAFSETWREDVWRKRLRELAPYNASCLFAVVPDVILDAHATLDRWHVYAPEVKTLGYKAAFATQNGCTIDLVPWETVDVLFVGGSNEHRVTECWPLIAEAKRRGLWVHVGRVNSPSAMLRFQAADSVDGTNFKYGSHRTDAKLLWILNAAERIRHQKCQTALLSMPD